MDDSSNKDDTTWNRLLITLGLVLWVSDLITDALTLREYWIHQPLTVAILSSISMWLSGLIGFGVLFTTVYALVKGEKEGYEPLVVAKCAETLVESIPQICVNFYVLASCSENIHAIQVISAIFSFAGICKGIVSFDQLLSKSSKESTKKSERNRETQEQQEEPLDWLEAFLLFITKVFSLLARVFILVYCVFYWRWWTVFPVTINFFIISSIYLYLKSKKDELNWGHIIVVLPDAYRASVWFMFVWSGDAKMKQRSTLILAILYCVANWILLAIAYNEKILFEPFCLYFDILGVNIGLNIAALACAILFTWKKSRDNKTFENIRKKGDKLRENIKTKILDLLQRSKKDKVHPTTAPRMVTSIDNQQQQLPREVFSQ